MRKVRDIEFPVWTDHLYVMGGLRDFKFGTSMQTDRQALNEK